MAIDRFVSPEWLVEIEVDAVVPDVVERENSWRQDCVEKTPDLRKFESESARTNQVEFCS